MAPKKSRIAPWKGALTQSPEQGLMAFFTIWHNAVLDWIQAVARRSKAHILQINTKRVLHPMSDETTRHYSGKSGSERAQRRRETLVESGLVLIADGGWRQLSIDGVCLHAGLHKRYFYESFENLDALGAAVVDALAAGFLHATGPILNSKRTIPELAHAVVDALVRYLTDNPRRARVLFGELTGSEAVTQQRKHAVRRIEAAVVQAATMIHGAGAAKDPIAGLAASVLVGGTGQAILDWLDGQLPMTREQFIDDLTSLWMITGEGAAAFGGKRQAAIG